MTEVVLARGASQTKDNTQYDGNSNSSHNEPIGSIAVLPTDVAEKIAAGEVIERPFSVVKELVENALDAGATQITVELENGGMRKIAVTDNGHGIYEEQVGLAFLRHATSKIRTADDLWNLRTLGFRGEALPSISAISQFTVETKRSTETGKQLIYEGGTLRSEKALAANSLVPSPHGTRMCVEHLFYNVPARLKFLKSKSSETAAIRDLIERISLIHTNVSFNLLSDGRKTLVLPSVQTTEERFAAVVQSSLENLLPFEGRYDQMAVNGVLDFDSRAQNSRQIYMAVNGRMVKDKLLQQAISVSLKPIMMEGEYPKIFLNIIVPSGDVDVNVHPTKTEVRFTKPRDVFSLIKAALDQIIVNPQRQAYSTTHVVEQKPQKLFDTDRVSFRKKVDELPTLIQTPTLPQTSAPWQTNPPINAAVHRSVNPLINPATQPTLQTTLQSTVQPQNLPYIGQVKNTYLLFQDHDGIVIVDQHAAHERLNYEKLKSNFFSSGLRPKALLIAITIKTSTEQAQLALDHKSFFERLGFEVDSFGDDQLIVRTVPEGLSDQHALQCFKAILEDLNTDNGELSWSDPTKASPRLERVFSTAACHASIRAGQPLSASEAIRLFQEMTSTASLNCPHGRPASVKLTHGQLEGLFKRS